MAATVSNRLNRIGGCIEVSIRSARPAVREIRFLSISTNAPRRLRNDSRALTSAICQVITVQNSRNGCLRMRLVVREPREHSHCRNRDERSKQSVAASDSSQGLKPTTGADARSRLDCSHHCCPSLLHLMASSGRQLAYRRGRRFPGSEGRFRRIRPARVQTRRTHIAPCRSVGPSSDRFSPPVGPERWRGT
jgi:hypothetical protein